jgi:hypothetical protein
LGPIGVVEIYNASEKTVVAYTLGCNITDSGPISGDTLQSGKKSLGVFSGPSITTRLKAKKSEKRNPGQYFAKQFETIFKAGIPKGVWIVVVGLTEVIFEDGSHWNADSASFHTKG